MVILLAPPPLLGSGRRGPEGLEGPFWPNMAPRGPQRTQDGLQDGSRQLKMAQYILRHTSMRPQGCPKTDPSAFRAFNGTLQDAKIRQKPGENQCVKHSRLFASDGLWKPQDGPREPKEGPKKAQEGPKIAQEAPKSAPRRPQDSV